MKFKNQKSKIKITKGTKWQRHKGTKKDKNFVP